MIFITLAFSGSAFALGNPDFSGTWTPDMAKSDMGQARPSAPAASTQKVTLVIKQTPSVLSITRKVGERSETATEMLDGSESFNKSPSGQDIKSINKWVGSTLATNSIMSTGGGTADWLLRCTATFRSVNKNAGNLCLQCYKLLALLPYSGKFG